MGKITPVGTVRKPYVSTEGFMGKVTRFEALVDCSTHIICNCACHQPNSGVMHFMACCFVCPKCKQRVHLMKTYKKHEQAIAAEKEQKSDE